MTWMTDPMPTDHVPADVLEQIRRAFKLSNDYVISDIECNCTPTTLAGSTARWYDTSSMLNPDELSPQAVDMNHEALSYAEEFQLIERHHIAPHLVRIRRGGA